MNKRGFSHITFHKKKKPKNEHPAFRQKLTLGQRAADGIAQFGGSWMFLFVFALFIVVWIVINAWLILREPFDPYPFILLNLTLSTLAAVQAPIILMAQNRQTERDRIHAHYDYKVNRKAEREIREIQQDLERIMRIVQRQKR